jgi:hypothetical protein
MCTKGLKTDQIVASISTADSEEGRRRGKNKKDAKRMSAFLHQLFHMLQNVLYTES